MKPEKIDRQRILAALNGLVGEVWVERPIGFAVRLEAFYQHYARDCIMYGEPDSPPLARDKWLISALKTVIDEPDLAEATVNVFLDRGWVIEDAEGDQL